MSTTTDNALFTFLRQNGVSAELIQEIAETLAFLFSLTEEEEIKLGEKVTSSRHMTALINGLPGDFGGTVQQVFLIKLSDLYQPPAWMTREAYHTFMQHNRSDLLAGINQSVGKMVKDLLEKRPEYADAEELEDIMYDVLMQPLEALITNMCGIDLGDCIYHDLFTILMNYLIYAIRGDREKMKPYQNLLKGMDRAIILGPKADDPTTWLVLTA